MNDLARTPQAFPLPKSEEVEDSGRPQLDLRSIFAALNRNKVLLAAVVVLAIVLSVAATLLATRKYEATASLQIQRESLQVLKSQDLETGSGMQDEERFLETQSDLLQSRSLALAVAADLRLFGNKAFLRAMGNSEDIEPVGALNKTDSERETIVRLLRENLSVKVPASSRIVQVRFESSDPVLAARVANSYAENFIKENLQRKFDASAYAREFLAGQLDQAKSRLEDSERAALKYSRSARLIDATNSAKETGSGPRSLTTAALIQLNSDYASAVTGRIMAEQKWQQAQGAGIMNLPEVLQNLAMQGLIQKQAELEAEVKDQRQVRRDDYPSVRRAQAQLDAIEREKASLASSIRNSIRSQYDVARRQEQALSNRMNALKQFTLAEQDRNVQLSIIQRGADTNRSLYDALLQRYRELSAEAGIQPNNISIIDRAEVPATPFSPNLIFNLALAVIGGIIVGAVLIFAREHLDDTFRNSDDLRQRLGLPVLGAIPALEAGTDVHEQLLDPKSPVTESFNSVRAALQLASSSGLPRSILFTSGQQSEGKSTCAFAMSQRLGKAGKRVVIVDLDMRRPSQHHNFGIKSENGISQVLASSATIDDVLLETKYENVTFICCGHMPPSPPELLSGERLPAIVEELKRRFECVVIDAPPTLGLADAVLLTARADATVIVVEAGRNHRGGLKFAIERLRGAGGNIIGAILTKYEAEKLGYGYDYNYSYNYSHDSGANGRRKG